MRLSDFPEILFKVSTTLDGNMSFTKGAQIEVIKNRKRFLETKHIATEDVISMFLVHGTKLVTVSNDDKNNGILSENGSLECDGLITQTKGLVLFLLVGDCLPIAFFDSKNEVIALIHGSRNNLDNQLLNKTIEVLQQLSDTKPKDLIVEIGPSIGSCCYTWTPGKNKAADKFWKEYIQKTSSNKYTLNLGKFVVDQLQGLGVLPGNITNQAICTYHNSDYFSHREFVEKDLENDYRFSVVLGMLSGDDAGVIGATGG